MCSAFNWKERRALGLDGAQAQLKEFKARPIGFDYADLEKHIDTSRGDSVVDLTNVDSWTETPRPAVNHRKVVDVAMLFGSNKPCGPYLSPREKETGVLKRFRRKFL